MPKICYQPKDFTDAHAETIRAANEIIEEYAGQGFALTLRQLYYQFVARALLANTQREYKRLGGIVSAARRAGLIDWNAIEDRTRFVRHPSTWEDPAEIVRAISEQYRVEKWKEQDTITEVWIEKDALIGVFEEVCKELDVALFSCRGYASDSEVWRAALRLLKYIDNGKRVRILHFGDHDPSGIDMTRDIEERLALFGASGVNVNRCALNMDQIEEFGPPPNPAKMTDPRFEGYIAEHGGESWELDALEPQVLASIVRERVEQVTDLDLWEETIAREERERGLLARVSESWPEVVDFIEEEA